MKAKPGKRVAKASDGDRLADFRWDDRIARRFELTGDTLQLRVSLIEQSKHAAHRRC